MLGEHESGKLDREFESRPHRIVKFDYLLIFKFYNYCWARFEQKGGRGKALGFPPACRQAGIFSKEIRRVALRVM